MSRVCLFPAPEAEGMGRKGKPVGDWVASVVVAHRVILGFSVEVSGPVELAYRTHVEDLVDHCTTSISA
jgi:hypothetical protein